MKAAESLPLLLQALRQGEPTVEVVALQGAPRPGERMLVSARGAIGSLGDDVLDREAVELARQALRDGRAATREVQVGGAAVLLYLEPHHGAGDLVIVGAGHIAQPLCRVGALLGYRVTVLDDRPEFATVERFPEADRVVRADFSAPLRDLSLGPLCHLVLVTRGHRYDFEVLRQVLAAPERPAYIGMIGSQRRVRAALEQLAAEGVPTARLREIYAPVGLDLGAETPAEIAIAVAAELVALRRGGTGAPLRDRARVVERWIQARGPEAVAEALPLPHPVFPDERSAMMDRLIAVESREDIFPELLDTPIGKLLEYHNLDRPFDAYSQAELLIGMCMDHRKQLRIPSNFAYVMRTAGANLRSLEFNVSFAISVGGARAIALIGHTQCGMVNVMSREQAFVEGLVERAGWEANAAEEHFRHSSPSFEIGNEIDFVASEAKRLRLRYPRIPVAPMLYRVEDNRLYLVRE